MVPLHYHYDYANAQQGREHYDYIMFCEQYKNKAKKSDEEVWPTVGVPIYQIGSQMATFSFMIPRHNTTNAQIFHYIFPYSS